MPVIFHDKQQLTVGDVYRYTIKYEPTRIATHTGPSKRSDPTSLFVRVKNAASHIYRAAYLSGPWTVAVSCYSTSFKTTEKSVSISSPPLFDPAVKTGTSFWAELDLTEQGRMAEKKEKYEWILEITSQTLFQRIYVPISVTIGTSHAEVDDYYSSFPLPSADSALSVMREDVDDLWGIPRDLNLSIHRDLHLVILTHGLKSNVTADLLYMKDAIESVASFRKRPRGGVIVRGYAGNLLKTERGIKWLGKRLGTFALKELGWSTSDQRLNPVIPYKYISFIGHSLGGNVQTFALAYMQIMTNYQIFKNVIPVNFVTLASPWLGLNAENPALVKLALSFGVVGKTGMDLGLTWRPTQTFETLSSLGTDERLKRVRDPRPILRLLALPDGPAHTALKQFQSHTIYANVVNDGIVPLRTSAMYFLDWTNFEPFEKTPSPVLKPSKTWSFPFTDHPYWEQMPNLNMFKRKLSNPRTDSSGQVKNGSISSNRGKNTDAVTIEGNDATYRADSNSRIFSKDQTILMRFDSQDASKEANTTQWKLRLDSQARSPQSPRDLHSTIGTSQDSEKGKVGQNTSNIHSNQNPVLSFLALMKPHAGEPKSNRPREYSRSQIVNSVLTPESSAEHSPVATVFSPPPKTNVLSNLGDLINPPLPSLGFIMDPALRKQTIYHDRVYHPSDIPPMTPSRQVQVDHIDDITAVEAKSQNEKNSTTEKLKLEEKIARDWHSDISWRKVLVKLDPEAHNNICVRRMFPNAYGWPVIDHLVQEHFATVPFDDNIDSLSNKTLDSEDKPAWSDDILFSDDDDSNHSVSTDCDREILAMVLDQQVQLQS